MVFVRFWELHELGSIRLNMPARKVVVNGTKYPSFEVCRGLYDAEG